MRRWRIGTCLYFGEIRQLISMHQFASVEQSGLFAYHLDIGSNNEQANRQTTNRLIRQIYYIAIASNLKV